MILYETDEQRKHIHTSWTKVEAIDEIYWRCSDCGVTSDEPTFMDDDPEKDNKNPTPPFLNQEKETTK